MENAKSATILKFNEGETITYEDIKAYYHLNEEAKKIKKDLDGLKDRIKNSMIQNNLDTLHAGEFSVQMTDKVTRKQDDDMLVSVLVSKGIQKETTEIKLVPVKERVISAISDGKLTQQEYDLCFNESHSQAMTVKKI